MLNWFMNLDMSIQLFIASVIGLSAGAIFTLFGEVVAPDDIIQLKKLIERSERNERSEISSREDYSR